MTPPPLNTPAAIRDFLADLLAQPPHPYQPVDRALQIRCAHALLRALALCPQDHSAPDSLPNVWQPARIPSPEEWNRHVAMAQANTAAWRLAHPGQTPPPDVTGLPDFHPDPACCSCLSSPFDNPAAA